MNTDDVMAMLGKHVPISLISDLSDPTGPHSDEILDAEGLPADAWWAGPTPDPTTA